MMGYNRQDVADFRKREIEEIGLLLDQAVDKIVGANRREWGNSYDKYKFFKKF